MHLIVDNTCSSGLENKPAVHAYQSHIQRCDEALKRLFVLSTMQSQHNSGAAKHGSFYRNMASTIHEPSQEQSETQDAWSNNTVTSCNSANEQSVVCCYVTTCIYMQIPQKLDAKSCTNMVLGTVLLARVTKGV